MLQNSVESRPRARRWNGTAGYSKGHRLTGESSDCGRQSAVNADFRERRCTCWGCIGDADGNPLATTDGRGGQGVSRPRRERLGDRGHRGPGKVRLLRDPACAGLPQTGGNPSLASRYEERRQVWQRRENRSLPFGQRGAARPFRGESLPGATLKAGVKATAYFTRHFSSGTGYGLVFSKRTRKRSNSADYARNSLQKTRGGGPSEENPAKRESSGV